MTCAPRRARQVAKGLLNFIVYLVVITNVVAPNGSLPTGNAFYPFITLD